MTDAETIARQALQEAKAKAKVGRIAAELGISQPAVSQWDVVPPGRVLDVERITGIPRHRLRPDLYPLPGAS